jgi:DNA-binding transcriptional ArsR family regulator
MDNVFKALSSTPRRKILAYLSKSPLSAGEISARFEMSKPAISKHLQILSAAGLISEQKKGQFVFYSIVEDNLTNTLMGYLSEVCPVSRKLKKESAEINKPKSQ